MRKHYMCMHAYMPCFLPFSLIRRLRVVYGIVVFCSHSDDQISIHANYDLVYNVKMQKAKKKKTTTG